MDITATITALVDWAQANPTTVGTTIMNLLIGGYSWYRTRRFVHEVAIKKEQRSLILDIDRALFALDRYFEDHGNRYGLNRDESIVQNYMTLRDQATVLIELLPRLFRGHAVFGFPNQWRRMAVEKIPQAPGSPITGIGSPALGIERARDLLKILQERCFT